MTWRRQGNVSTRRRQPCAWRRACIDVNAGRFELCRVSMYLSVLAPSPFASLMRAAESPAREVIRFQGSIATLVSSRAFGTLHSGGRQRPPSAVGRVQFTLRRLQQNPLFKGGLRERFKVGLRDEKSLTSTRDAVGSARVRVPTQRKKVDDG